MIIIVGIKNMADKYEIQTNKYKDMFFTVKNDEIIKVFLNRNKCLKYTKEKNKNVIKIQKD